MSRELHQRAMEVFGARIVGLEVGGRPRTYIETSRDIAVADKGTGQHLGSINVLKRPGSPLRYAWTAWYGPQQFVDRHKGTADSGAEAAHFVRRFSAPLQSGAGTIVKPGFNKDSIRVREVGTDRELGLALGTKGGLWTAHAPTGMLLGVYKTKKAAASAIRSADAGYHRTWGGSEEIERFKTPRSEAQFRAAMARRGVEVRRAFPMSDIGAKDAFGGIADIRRWEKFKHFTGASRHLRLGDFYYTIHRPTRGAPYNVVVNDHTANARHVLQDDGTPSRTGRDNPFAEFRSPQAAAKAAALHYERTTGKSAKTALGASPEIGACPCTLRLTAKGADALGGASRGWIKQPDGSFLRVGANGTVIAVRKDRADRWQVSYLTPASKTIQWAQTSAYAYPSPRAAMRAARRALTGRGIFGADALGGTTLRSLGWTWNAQRSCYERKSLERGVPWTIHKTRTEDGPRWALQRGLPFQRAAYYRTALAAAQAAPFGGADALGGVSLPARGYKNIKPLHEWAKKAWSRPYKGFAIVIHKHPGRDGAAHAQVINRAGNSVALWSGRRVADVAKSAEEWVDVFIEVNR